MLLLGYLPSSEVAGVAMVECSTLDVPLTDAEGCEYLLILNVIFYLINLYVYEIIEYINLHSEV